MDDLNEKKQGKIPKSFNNALITVATQVGCLTVSIILGTLAIGMWLDNVFGTSPWILLGLLIISMPIALFVMFKVATATTKRMVIKPPVGLGITPEQEEEIE
jgi:F0F1-type ATP synthase assembly protein I